MKPMSDLSNKTKAELTTLARRKKIPVASGMLKDELIKTIKKGLRKIEAQKKPKTAQKPLKNKSPQTSKTKTVRKPKSSASKTASTKNIKTAIKKKATDKKIPAKVKVKKATAKKSAPRKPKAVRSPKKVVSQTRSTPEQTKLPERYNDHCLVALARDPNWAYLYWDLKPARVRDLLSNAKQTADKARWVLLVYSAELHPAEAKGNFFDINIDVKNGSYYLDLARPGARFIVEIGVIDTSGMFRTTAQSNPIILPTDRPSESIAPEGTAPSQVPDSPVRSK